MAEEMESVKVSASTMATIREWAAATNRNVWEWLTASFREHLRTTLKAAEVVSTAPPNL